MSSFTHWLRHKLAQHGWTYSELARRAQLSPAAISRLLSEERQPGVRAARSLAHAFQLPPELVFRQAALLPPRAPDRYQPLLETVCLLDDDALAFLLRIARSLPPHS
ncbi:MAG: helix-turn-helix transcriptional regulator [Chloroflexota bacterium]|nr:helix-turn-helix transcriptional regulator [Chloroflexota bacterium]